MKQFSQTRIAPRRQALTLKALWLLSAFGCADLSDIGPQSAESQVRATTGGSGPALSAEGLPASSVDPASELAPAASGGQATTTGGQVNENGVSADGESSTPRAVDAGSTAEECSTPCNGVCESGECTVEFSVRARSENPEEQVVEVHPFFEIYNHTGTEVPLNELTLTYYFSREKDEAEVSDCFWVTADSRYGNRGKCDHLGIRFDGVPGAPFNQRRLEVSFDSASGTLAAGDVIEVRISFHLETTPIQNQPNDYSFTPTTVYAEEPKVVLKRNGLRLWGTEPDPAAL